MVTELMLVFGIILGGMIGFGIKPKQEQKDPVQVNLRSTVEQKELMLQCRAICGEGRVLSFDILTGTCKCLPQE